MTFKTFQWLSVSLACGGMLSVMAATPSAQRGRGPDPNQPVPLATNTILQNPDKYFGRPVTISAGVEQVLSKTAFVIDQRKAVGANEVKAIGKPILVIAPYLSGVLDQQHYLLLTGQIVKFDAAAVARVATDYKIDLGPEVSAKYAGQPVLVAMSVRNSTYVEIGRKPLPPPSPEELSLNAAMKAIGPAFAELRTAAQEMKTDVVMQDAAKLEPAFTQAETIWDDMGHGPAADWSRDARAQAAAIKAAAAAGNLDKAKASAAALNQLCTNCHAAYRDRQEDGTFRIKAGLY